MYHYEALFPLVNLDDLCPACGQLVNTRERKVVYCKIVVKGGGEHANRNLELNTIILKF